MTRTEQSQDLLDYNSMTSLSEPGEYGYSGLTEDEGLFNPRALLNTLIHRWWLILSLVLLVTSVAAVNVYRQKSIYQASATIEVNQENGVMIREGVALIGGDNYTDIQTAMFLLQSRPLLEEVVKRLQLDKNKAFTEVSGTRSLWEAMMGQSAKTQQTLSLDDQLNREPVMPEKTRIGNNGKVKIDPSLSPLVGQLRNGLQISQVPDTRLVKITYSHYDPELASLIVNGVSECFIDRSFKKKVEQYSNTSEWLDSTTRKFETQVKQAEQNLADYTRTHGIFNTDGKEDLTTTKLSQLHDQVMRAETERILKQSLFDQVQQGKVSQLPEAFVNPATADLQKKLSELTISAAQMSVKFGSKNPRVIEAQQQIAALQQEIAGSQKTLEEKLKADFERAVRDEKSLNEVFNRAKAAAVEQNQTSIQYSILKQNVDTSKALYTDFLMKTNQAEAQMAEQHRNVSFAEPAEKPAFPIGPNRMRVIMIAFFLGLIGSIGIVLTLDFLDNKVKNVEDLTRYTRLPTLGAIPAISSSTGANNDGTAMLLTQNDQDRSTELFYSASESYRRLRTSLLLASAGRPPRTILFTSSIAGEGKTTTAVNVGSTLSSMGARVLIIDADMRKPRLHKIFSLNQKPGLSAYLSGDVDLDDLVYASDQQNLWLMPAGVIPPNSSDLVSSEKMIQLLQQASEKFDHVLIDSPPVLGASDPVIISRLVDGVILVVRSEKSTRDVVRHATQDLKRVGAKIFGTVLNNVRQRNDTYNSYYYHAHSDTEAE